MTDRSRKLVVGAIACALWLGVVITAMMALVQKSITPGDGGDPSKRWPGGTAIGLNEKIPTLVMFIHPRCPCTRATLGELERLLARCSGRVSTHLVFIHPINTGRDWVNTDLFRRASAIPEVRIHVDRTGEETKRFNCKTSGHAMLYGTDGSLIFEGGMTRARGHSGDNPGRSALVNLLENKHPLVVNTPVFGCPLVNVECATEESQCKN
jgi:hypothetical protein